jgi:alpha-galactosidase
MLAHTPPMGWANWNHYFCDYDEGTIREQANALVASGMRDAGYRYVLIQECIARKRDAHGNLIADPHRFPSGMAALTAYIHGLGLKAGIYTDIGVHTCFPNPQYQGSYGHEQQDADLFAAWGMDLVEMDYCNRVPGHSGRWEYERMAKAIRNTGRPMLFYICSWGDEQPWEWAQGTAQMWRTDIDISFGKNLADWDRVVGNFESNARESVLNGPDSWNDGDMLEIGNPGLTDDEAQAQMSMWAISAAPLLAGTDVAHMSERTRATYLNAEVLAVNQDPLGAGAEKIAEDAPGHEVWAKPLGARTSGDYAVMLLNTTEQPATMRLGWAALDLLTPVHVRDLWQHKELVPEPDGWQTTVAAHSAVLLRVVGARAWLKGAVYAAAWPGITRTGAAKLLVCAECAHGYAVSLGGNHRLGSLRVPQVVAPAGEYTLRLQYVRNGLDDQEISVKVNEVETKVVVPQRAYGFVDVPVRLRESGNVVTVSNRGPQPFHLSQLTLLNLDRSVLPH